MQTTLQIPTPCHEKWSEMAPVRHDCRHCAACERQIMDFTMKTDAEILEHLRRNQGKVCGKFRPDQLKRPLMTPRAVKHGGLSAIAASFAAVLSAQQPVSQTIEPVATEQVPSDADRTTLGRVVYYNFLEPDSMRTISGKIMDENGEVLIGATVRFAQTSIGTSSNYEGIFNLKIPLDSLKENPLEIHIRYIEYLEKVVILPKQVLFEDLALIPDQTTMKSAGVQQMELMGVVFRELSPLEYRPTTLKSRTRRFFWRLFHK